MRDSESPFPALSLRAGSVSHSLLSGCPRSRYPRVPRDTPPALARLPLSRLSRGRAGAADPAAASLGPAGPFRGRDADCRAFRHPAVAWGLCPLPSMCTDGEVVSFSPLPRPGVRPDEAKLNRDAVEAAFVTTEIPCMVTQLCGDTCDRAAPQLPIPCARLQQQICLWGCAAPELRAYPQIHKPLSLCDADCSVRQLSCRGGGTSAGQSTIQQPLDLLCAARMAFSQLE